MIIDRELIRTYKVYLDEIELCLELQGFHTKIRSYKDILRLYNKLDVIKNKIIHRLMIDYIKSNSGTKPVVQQLDTNNKKRLKGGKK